MKIGVAMLALSLIAGCSCPAGTPEWHTKVFTSDDGKTYVIRRGEGSESCTFGVTEANR